MDLEVSEIKEHCAQKFQRSHNMCSEVSYVVEHVPSRITGQRSVQWSLVMGSEVHRSKIIGSKGS